MGTNLCGRHNFDFFQSFFLGGGDKIDCKNIALFIMTLVTTAKEQAHAKRSKLKFGQAYELDIICPSLIGIELMYLPKISGDITPTIPFMFHRVSDNNREPNLLLCSNFLPLELRIGHSNLARVKKYLFN